MRLLNIPLVIAVIFMMACGTSSSDSRELVAEYLLETSPLLGATADAHDESRRLSRERSMTMAGLLGANPDFSKIRQAIQAE